MVLYTKREIYKMTFMLLDKFNLKQVPVDIYTLANKLNINLVPFSLVPADDLDIYMVGEKYDDGFSFYEDLDKQLYAIYYDDSKSQKQVKEVICREMGRFIFSDLCDEDYEDIQEDFVAMMLVPMVSLFFLEEVKVEAIEDVFNVNQKIAKNIFKIFNDRLTKYGNRLFEFEADSFLQFE